MTEAFEHNPGDHEDPVSGQTWLIGFLGALVLVAMMLGLTAIYYNAKAREINKVVIIPERQEVRQLLQEQESLLAGPPRWVTRDDGAETVEALIIPIEWAMELVVAEAEDR